MLYSSLTCHGLSTLRCIRSSLTLRGVGHILDKMQQIILTLQTWYSKNKCCLGFSEGELKQTCTVGGKIRFEVPICNQVRNYVDVLMMIASVG